MRHIALFCIAINNYLTFGLHKFAYCMKNISPIWRALAARDKFPAAMCRLTFYNHEFQTIFYNENIGVKAPVAPTHLPWLEDWR